REFWFHAETRRRGGQGARASRATREKRRQPTKNPSFPRRRESILGFGYPDLRRWVPAFAGTTEGGCATRARAGIAMSPTPGTPSLRPSAGSARKGSRARLASA